MPTRLLTCRVDASGLIACPKSSVIHPHWPEYEFETTVKIDTGANQSVLPLRVIAYFNAVQGLGRIPQRTTVRVATNEPAESFMWLANLCVRGLNGNTWYIDLNHKMQTPRFIAFDREDVILGMDLLRLAAGFQYTSNLKQNPVPGEAEIRLDDRHESWPI